MSSHVDRPPSPGPHSGTHLRERRRDLVVFGLSLLGATLLVLSVPERGEGEPPDPPPPEESDGDVLPETIASGDATSRRFSHASHEDLACTTCHAAVPGTGSIADDLTSSRATCGVCHGDDSSSGSDTEERPIRTEREPTRSSSMAPSNHTVDWIERHANVARSQSSQCAECHTEDDCSSCHDEELAEPFSVHPPNFNTLHAIDAQSQTGNCTDCHTPETFCASCHARTKFAATPPDDPPPRVEVHPPNWTEPNAPNNHAAEARRNITECASCHTERDCVTCHESVDPHPPEFRLNCGKWLDSSPSTCLKCHDSTRRLKTMCL